MRRSSFSSLSQGLLALALLAVPLSACSTTYFGGASAFGNNQLQPTEVANIGSYTADGALAEARGHFRNNDFGYSATLYKRVVELTPKDPQGYVGLAASYDRLNRFDLSDRVYASLYQLTGATPQYYNNVGYSYLLRGNLSAALASFRKAQKLDPGNVVVADNIQMLTGATSTARG